MRETTLSYRTAGAAVLATATVLATALAALLGTGTAIRDVAATTGYLAAGIVLPGTVVVRWSLGRRGGLLADAAVGAAAGYGLEVFAYCLARAVGHPMAVLAWPVLVVGGSLLMPAARRRVWGREAGPADPTPPAMAWGLTAVCVAALTYLGIGGLASTPLTGPAATTPYSDLPFHLALVGELRHHLPPITPYVTTEPLAYHWFVHAHLAAASWVTGTEPVVLLTRTELVPFTVLTVLLTGVLGRQLSGSAIGGVLAATLAAVGGPVFAHGWSTGVFGSGQLLTSGLWLSPTQSYATMLLVATLVVAGRLTGVAGGRTGDAESHGPAVRLSRQLPLFALLVAACAGAKATVLPLIAAGLTVALAIAVARRLRATAVAATGMLTITVVTGLAAIVVLFGGQAQGLTVRPLLTIAQLPVARLVGAPPEATTPHGATTAAALPAGVLITLTVLCLVSWLAVGAGLVGLGRRWLEPGVGVLAGLAAIGPVAALLTTQPGVSQLYFLRTAAPAVAVLSAAGLVRLTRHTARPVAAITLGTGLLAGAVLAALVAAAGPDRPTPSGRWWRVPAELAAPYLLLAALVIVGTVVAWRTIRGSTVPARLITATALAAVTGLGLPAPVVEAWRYLGQATSGGYDRPAPGRPSIPPGGIDTARWLRDNSDPDDLVATNSHCWDSAALPGGGDCDTRSFWVSAYAERRVLVQGWGYTATANAPYQRDTNALVTRGPYWDQKRLTTNDAVFSHPSEASVGELRNRYGVRWLLADRRVGEPPVQLRNWATLRYSAGRCEVYELR